MGTTASLALIPLLCHPTASGKDLGIPKSSQDMDILEVLEIT